MDKLTAYALRPVATRDEMIVEINRLSKIVSNMAIECGRLRNLNAQLNEMLGQAQAGMELADLIKRMISNI